MSQDLSETSQAVPTRVTACLRALGLSRFKLIGKQVYQAYSPSFGWVAVKIAISPSARLQLQIEARFLAKFTSAHWPSYIDFGSHQQVDWLITSLCNGIPLSAAVIGQSQRLALLSQSEAILQQLHGSGFIHGDIKPSNIIVNESDQQLTLIDFGSVLPIGEHYQTLTSSLSPRFSGANATYRYGQISPRDDYVALAITLQTVFHHHPFDSLPISQFCHTQRSAQAPHLPSRYQILLQQQLKLAKQR